MQELNLEERVEIVPRNHKTRTCFDIQKTPDHFLFLTQYSNGTTIVTTQQSLEKALFDIQTYQNQLGEE